MLHSDSGSPLTIGANVTVGHHAILHGCTIRDRVLIGMGAQALNDAVVAEDRLVGAGALVTEGKRFPPRSLIVGTPAAAKRELSRAIASIARSAEAYRDKALRFRHALKPVQDA